MDRFSRVVCPEPEDIVRVFDVFVVLDFLFVAVSSTSPIKN